MRRVLLLIKGLGAGGAERLLVNAAPHADRSRFEYEVAYLLPQLDALRPELERAGLRVHCLDGARGAGWMWRLRRLVVRMGFDLVHAHSPYAAAGARLALAPPTPFVFTEHDVWPSYHRVTRLANALTYPRNDHVFAVSDRVRASVRYPPALRFLRMPPLETLYQGVDPRAAEAGAGRAALRRELGVPEDALLVGTVANYRPEKGHRHLLEAAASVRERIPDARFLLVGGGPLEAQVRQDARDRGLDGTVIFDEPRREAAHVAAAFDVFVLASLHEGLPIALLEAMTLGRPVVVTDAGGIPEVVRSGEHGVVVPAGQPQALADGICAVASDRALAERLGAAARRRAADFDIRRTVRRMEEVYDGLVA